MFEHRDTYYNARYVKVIGKVQETNMQKFRFSVDFEGDHGVPFTYETRDDAERERLNLVIAVNKANGE